ncbi:MULTISPECIES: phage replisome organizer N-terminal domain-containing protein [Clostridium]|uniref:Phage protein n=1 Tax=Clostridium botulinum B2 450 TaxID=1379739 RepID=A0A0D1BY74_CLOBO|nr:phage replisome organizer N-terminal domain-containing protein [Clostridium botulinum]KIS24902.1 phage protein [Clostridium botulinum B2 450]MDU5116561.1 phage replisome organizer N-terminal domain-containing protein [Clostridium botulinum]
MSDNKKYYYLRIKENFYDTEDIKILQSMDNGYLYSDILMKLYLKSLKNEGRLMFKEHIPYNPKMVATVTGHNIAIVEKAIKVFIELGLIEILDNGAIYMLDIQNFIGKSSSEGDRKRAYRKKIEMEKQNLLPKGQMSDERPPEIELEKEIDIELDIEKDTELEKKKKKKGSKKEGTKKTYNTIIDEYTENEELKNTILEFIKMRTLIKSKMTNNALDLMLKNLDKLSNDDDIKIKILEQSIMNSWKGVFPLKQESIKQNSSNTDSSNVFLDMLNGGV